MELEIRLVTIDDLQAYALSSFNRYQETTWVLYVDNGQELCKEDYFVDDWDDEKKQQVIQSLCQCILSGGFVVGALEGGKNLIGFASIEGKFLGSRKQYLELSYIHVSTEKRNCGIGKSLFRFCCALALEKGAKKLYISAHPSVETQEFYQRMGCVLAVEINQEVFEREPLDIQLEFLL